MRWSVRLPRDARDPSYRRPCIFAHDSLSWSSPACEFQTTAKRTLSRVPARERLSLSVGPSNVPGLNAGSCTVTSLSR
jgi:hypothetical protein